MLFSINPLTDEEIQQLFVLFLTQNPRLPCKLVDLTTNQYSETIKDFYNSTTIKEQCLLIRANEGHWLAIHLKKIAGVTSFIILDAANCWSEIFLVLLQLKRFLNSSSRQHAAQTNVTLIGPSTFKDTSIQRDHHSCGIFAFQHFQLAATQPQFHEKMSGAARKNSAATEGFRSSYIATFESNQEKQKLPPEFSCPPEMLLRAMLNYKKDIQETAELITYYLDYQNFPKEFGAFFLNTQTVDHDHLLKTMNSAEGNTYEEVEKWRMETQKKSGEWVVYNTRAKFFTLSYRAQLYHRRPTEKDSLLLAEVCHSQNTEDRHCALRRAAKKGLPYQVKILIAQLSNQFDINMPDSTPTSHKTALHHAILQACDSAHSHEMKKRYIEVINILLLNGGDLDKQDADGKTPRDYAKKCPEILTYLITEEEKLFQQSDMFFSCHLI